MRNAIRPVAELRPPAPSSEQNVDRGPPGINRLKLSPQALRALWGDFVTLASIGVCAWLLFKIVFHAGP